VSLSQHILDVSEATFESEVILKSHELPVVVDFWAPWCGPCRVLGPLLERLAIEGGGSFLLAKLNVDDNPRLAIRYGVQGIPAVKAFVQGEVKGQFVGVQPEGMVRRFIQSLAPSKAQEAVQEGSSLLATRHWPEAERAFREVLDEDETNSAAALGLLSSLLMQGKGRQALAILQSFPPGPELATAERLKPLAEFIVEAEDSPVGENGDALTAGFHQAARLMQRGNLQAAMDGLLEALRQDKHYRGGAAKAVLLACFALLGENDPLTREYREELASILF